MKLTIFFCSIFASIGLLLHAQEVLYTKSQIPLHIFAASKTTSTLNEKEQFLIDHVQKAIELGSQKISKLSSSVLLIDGMSTAQTRCFLNALGTLPQTNYLEIGCWKGSTFISTLYGNESTINSAVGIDNWSEFGGPYALFQSLCHQLIASIPYQFYSQDCFTVDLSSFQNPVNIYFYDGNHTKEAQADAFLYFDSILDDVFIAVIDDWNHHPAREGTFEAFRLLNYEILFEASLPANYNCDVYNWWNGLYVAVIRKNNSTITQKSD